MAISSVHPKYLQFSALWLKMRDCFLGADHVKAQGTLYLPPTPAMRYDGMKPGEDGYIRYNDYKDRAVFPEYVADAVVNHSGMLHSKSAIIQLPAAMEPLRQSATSKREGLDQLLRRINELQLRDGRLGLLLELPAGSTRDTLPYIAVYEALSIRNWDDGEDDLGSLNLNLVVLDESKEVMDKTSFDWTYKVQYRVLVLGSANVDEPTDSGYVYGQYMTELLPGEDDEPEEVSSDVVVPQYKGTPLEQIPFVFCNAMDLVPEPDKPPLLALANRCISIYQGEADYRQALFMQSQDTLVVRGGITNSDAIDDKAPVRVGAGARIDVSPDGDAKYIGTNSQGLPEQRKALEADHKDAQTRSGHLTSAESAAQESGDALETRLITKTASLVGIAKTGAAALEKILRICAIWMGLNPDEVKVTPNLDFSKANIEGQELVQVQTAKNLGAPLCAESMHNWLQDKGMTSLTFEEEMKRLEEERKEYPFLLPQVKNDQNQIQQTTGEQTGNENAAK